MFMIIIHVFQMDINCILMKYYFHVHDHDCCIFIPIRDPKINKSQFSHPPAINRYITLCPDGGN